MMTAVWQSKTTESSFRLSFALGHDFALAHPIEECEINELQDRGLSVRRRESLRPHRLGQGWLGSVHGLSNSIRAGFGNFTCMLRLSLHVVCRQRIQQGDNGLYRDRLQQVMLELCVLEGRVITPVAAERN